MVVGTCIIELDLPGISSLKQKRSCLKGLIARLHRTFNISVAEVDLHDVWQSSTLGATVVSTTTTHAEHVMENAVRWIEDHRPDVMVVDYQVETMHF